MKITIVYRYFLPDAAPYGLLLAEMIPWLVSAGHEVKVFAGQPSYAADKRHIRAPASETMLGAQIRRVSLPGEKRSGVFAIVAMIWFCIRAALHVLVTPRQDIVWFGTTPPVLQALLVGLAARLRGSATIYQLQDIHPEIAIASGEMRPGLVSSLLRKLDNFTLRNVSRAVTLSSDMAEVIREEAGKDANVAVINNFAIGLNSEAVRPQERTGKVRICFAGNIGNFQNLDAFIEAFAALNRDDVTLEFIGDGKMRKSLEQQARQTGLTNIMFHGRVSAEHAFEMMSRCDVGLISLKPGLYWFAFPSKSQTYMAAHLRLIAMIEGQSELAQSIGSHDLGRSIDWMAGQGEIARVISEVVDLVLSDRTGGRAPDHLWHGDHARRRWLALLDELAPEAERG